MTTIAAALDAALKAAGVPIDGVSLYRNDVGDWDIAATRISFKAAVTDEQRAEARAILDAFDPASVRPPRRVDFEDALQRLTQPEWSALRSALNANVRLDLWFRRAMARGSVDLNDPEVEQAFAAVVEAGLFTRARLAELFAAPA
jgi:hypothetical protein